MLRQLVKSYIEALTEEFQEEQNTNKCQNESHMKSRLNTQPEHTIIKNEQNTWIIIHLD